MGYLFSDYSSRTRWIDSLFRVQRYKKNPTFANIYAKKVQNSALFCKRYCKKVAKICKYHFFFVPLQSQTKIQTIYI